MSTSQIKALNIIKDNPGLSARLFAKLMWPDSSMHTSVKNTGNGATAGKAAWLCGGSYIAKLRKKGLVKVSYYFEGPSLTVKGEQLIKENES